MVIEKDDQKKQVVYWLTKEEGANQALKDSLKSEYKEWYDKGYFVATFFSGDGDLYDSTLGLLLHNRKSAVIRQLQEEKAEKAESQ